MLALVNALFSHLFIIGSFPLFWGGQETGNWPRGPGTPGALEAAGLLCADWFVLI